MSSTSQLKLGLLGLLVASLTFTGERASAQVILALPTRGLYSNPYGFQGPGVGYSYSRVPYTYTLGYQGLPGRYRSPALTRFSSGFQGYRYPNSYRFSYAPGSFGYYGPSTVPGSYRPLTRRKRSTSFYRRGTDRRAVPGFRPLTRPDPDPTRKKQTLPTPQARPAELTLRVPARAELWFEGTKTRQTGTERVFATPPLDVGAKYAYTVRMRWTEGGKMRERTREIIVRAGDRQSIDLTQPISPRTVPGK